MEDNWTHRTELLLGQQAMTRLQQARLVVFGVGGVGSWCIEALARAGVGHITIVDSDTVAPSNINRQLVADHDTLGQLKVTIMARRIHAINPTATVHAVAGVYDPQGAPLGLNLTDYDLVVDAIDSITPKAALIVGATQARVPLVSSMGAALKTDILQISTAHFDDVKGCALARALRQRFKRTGVWPARRFRCVYSAEQPPRQAPGSDGISATPNGRKRVNGTLVTTTATFGLLLAQLALYELTKG